MRDATPRDLGDLIRGAGRIAVFTGAGISTESGISDYRSKGGLWDRFRPVYYQEFLQDEEARAEYWRRKRELYGQLAGARPNAAHRAIARLERRGLLLGVITQNIDGLHQEAGNAPEKVLEIHGTNRVTLCLTCEHREDWKRTRDRLEAGERAPRCPACGGIQKPATISFGEMLDPGVLRRAEAWAEACDLMLVVGSTLVVEPAASLPRIAKAKGARLAIVNLGDTPLDDLADVRIAGRAGETLEAAIPTTSGNS